MGSIEKKSRGREIYIAHPPEGGWGGLVQFLHTKCLHTHIKYAHCLHTCKVRAMSCCILATHAIPMPVHSVYMCASNGVYVVYMCCNVATLCKCCAMSRLCNYCTCAEYIHTVNTPVHDHAVICTIKEQGRLSPPPISPVPFWR